MPNKRRLTQYERVSEFVNDLQEGFFSSSAFGGEVREAGFRTVAAAATDQYPPNAFACGCVLYEVILKQHHVEPTLATSYDMLRWYKVCGKVPDYVNKS
jgi:hypothetical protein